MSSGGRVRSGPGTGVAPVRVVAASLLGLLALLAGCQAGGDAALGDVLPATPLPAEEDPGPVHVHGLGVNPADGQVYVATHFGLWRLPGDGVAERVGEASYDLMGFTILGGDHFVASGHPLLTDDLPPLLGLIETTDGGRTWRSLSLLGAADFHALRVAHDAVWGWNSTDGALMTSDDRETWTRRSTVPSLLDFVVDPRDAEHVLAAVADGLAGAALQRSSDGGRTWGAADGPALVRLAWEEPDRLWGITAVGAIWRSADGGETWEEAGAAVGRPEAFADAGDRMLVAADGAISQSQDGGATWTDLYRHH